MSLFSVNQQTNQNEWLALARITMEREADAILKVSARLGTSFVGAVQLILNHTGKVIVSGVGKSGHIAQKCTATLCSTGTPAVFLHPTEAFHGDLGVYSAGDPTILISKSGSTAELVRLIPILRSFQSPLIAVVGNQLSPLAQQCDIVLDATVNGEADPLGIVPTSSTMTALALGDALASALMYARRFTAEKFAAFHPGGQLGRNLSLKVSEVMHRGKQIAWAKATDPIKYVIVSMTEHPLGAACVLDTEYRLVGLITDGDLRRAIQRYDDIRPLVAADIMTRQPIVISPDASVRDALQLMEDRPSQLSVLPVCESETQICLGLIRIHDIYQPSLV